MSQDLRLSTTTATGALSTSVLVSAAMAIPVGRWLDLHGGRGVMTGGSVLAIVAVAGWSQVQSAWQLYAVFVLIGIASAMVLYQPAFAVIVATTPSARRSNALLQRAGIEPLAGPLPLPERLQEVYQVQLDNLPAEARASCSSARRIVFRHPLLRAAAYRSATVSERIDAHRCLAEALDPELDADRRAWHLAASVTGPDDRIAAELDHCGERALQRGGPATASTAFEKAAWLTASTSERARRLSAAAQAANLAGHPARAERLVERSDRLTADLVVQAHNRRLRASMAFDRGSPASTHRLLLTEIGKVATADPELAALMLFDAVKNAWFANDRDWSREATRVLHALVPRPDSPQRSAVRVVLDLSDRLEVLTEGRPLGLPAAYDEGTTDHNPSPVELVLQAAADLSLADDDAALAAAETAVRVCRTGGQIGLLVLSLQILATVEMLTGRYRYARANATEGLELSMVLGQQNRSCHFEALLAWLEAVAGKAECCRGWRRAHWAMPKYIG